MMGTFLKSFDTDARPDPAGRLELNLNFKVLSEGNGAPVTARFGEAGITIVDSNHAIDGKIF